MITPQNPAPTATDPVEDRRVQPDGPLSGEVKRGGAEVALSVKGRGRHAKIGDEDLHRLYTAIRAATHEAERLGRAGHHDLASQLSNAAQVISAVDRELASRIDALSTEGSPSS